MIYIINDKKKYQGADVRILIKSVEEFHKCKGFVRVFPTRYCSFYSVLKNIINYKLMVNNVVEKVN